MVKMKRKDFNGFSVNIFLDDDGDWMAHFVELPNVSACGSSVEEALQELKIAWDEVKNSYRQHGEPVPVAPSQKKYSGHFNVRIDKRLHRHLAMEAALAGLSLNALISQKLTREADYYN